MKKLCFIALFLFIPTLAFAQAPINFAGESIQGIENTELAIPTGFLLANDESATGNPLVVLIAEDPINGQVSLDSNLSVIRFTPDINFRGNAGFAYGIADAGTADNDFANIELAFVSIDVGDVATDFGVIPTPTPTPAPILLTDLLARIEALEEENDELREQIEEIEVDVAAVEAQSQFDSTVLSGPIRHLSGAPFTISLENIQGAPSHVKIRCNSMIGRRSRDNERSSRSQVFSNVQFLSTTGRVLINQECTYAGDGSTGGSTGTSTSHLLPIPQNTTFIRVNGTPASVEIDILGAPLL